MSMRRRWSSLLNKENQLDFVIFEQINEENRAFISDQFHTTYMGEIGYPLSP